MFLLIRWLLNAVALLIVANIIPGVDAVFPNVLIAALVLGIANAIIRPILIILTLPLEIITLGLFTFVINAALFWGVGQLGLGLTVHGVWPAFWGALVLSIISFFISRLLAAARV
ncbi:MAG TPA: phage holin family protein [Candidatus Binatia bacterium]|nr:phage holin family protein [Candidatus Binatia bacterium]